MQDFRCVIARTAGEIAEAQRLRWRVFGEEEGLLAGSSCVAGREVDSGDDDDRMTHFIVYAGREPAGTIRLLEANEEEEERADTGLIGLHLESKFDLGALAAPGVVPAEVTRFCLLRRYRRSRAAGALFSALCAESACRGITHWVAAANMETDVAEDAALAYRAIRERNLVSERFRIEPRSFASPASLGRRPYYSEEQRRLAGESNGRAVDPPRTLMLFARGMGARYAGPPVYDAYFGVFALPLVATLPLDRRDVTVRRRCSRRWRPALEGRR
jgi:hypothetical protein